MLLDEKETYQLKIDKWKTAGNLLVISFFNYRMPNIIYQKWQLDPLSAWSILYAIITVILLFVTVRLIRQLFRQSLVFEMSDTGIKTRTFGFMDWKNIDDVKVTKDKVLLMYLNNTDEFSEALNVSKFQRKMMEAYAQKQETPFAIQVAETNYKAVEFETALAKFRKKDPSV
jgi:hypothetical protein